MSELIRLLETVVAEAEGGRPVALCAVVETMGSTPQPPGAAMLVRSDFTTLGTLGGGCVEAEVRQQAFKLLQRNSSGLLDFALDRDYGWEDGLICGGRIYIAVTPVTRDVNLKPFQEALERAKGREPTQVPVMIEHEGKRLEYRLHVEVPPTLLIAGAGHIGQAVARLAVDLDFHVVVIDDRANFAARQRFGERVELIVDDIGRALRAYPIDGGCYVVIVTRGHQQDHAALEAVIRRPAGYIGMIGSKRKSRMILNDLADAGVPPEMIDRVHTPIGLPVNAVTVPEIAVSIMAELIQTRRQNTPKLVEGPFEVTGTGK
ncbi:MAG: XdhC family protein [Phycisphaerae bacterium]